MAVGGVENLVIVSTKDAVLVMNRERSQDVKKAVEFLKQNQRSEYKRHREIYRPWGPLRRSGPDPALQRQPHNGETRAVPSRCRCTTIAPSIGLFSPAPVR